MSRIEKLLKNDINK